MAIAKVARLVLTAFGGGAGGADVAAAVKAVSTGKPRMNRDRSTGPRRRPAPHRQTSLSRLAAAQNPPKLDSPHLTLHISLEKDVVLNLAKDVARAKAAAAKASAAGAGADAAAAGAAGARILAIKLVANATNRTAGNAMSRSAARNRRCRNNLMHRSSNRARHSPLRSLPPGDALASSLGGTRAAAAALDGTRACAGLRQSCGGAFAARNDTSGRCRIRKREFQRGRGRKQTAPHRLVGEAPVGWRRLKPNT